ncbi:MAG TPA: hypothetical protein VM935_09330 [Chitinophagaceae bacterium]|jgi:hypothetical protein|nr:hypothetical protein [Chitinophagaceae bacterium]
MEKNIDQFSPEQSLQLIESMISKTKANISENTVYFLLWGWLSFSAILGQYFLKVALDYPHHYLVWLITFVGIFGSIMQTRKRKQYTHARTYIGASMSYLWTGLGVSFFILTLIFFKLEDGWLICYPFFIMLYGLGTFVSGKILQFKPLVIGGIINWVLAIAATFFDFDNQMLFAAAAILTSYIIPGHLLQAQKKENG